MTERDGRERASGLHLAVIFDGSFAAWQRLYPTFSLTETIEALILYLNAHLAYAIANDVAVFDVDGAGATCIYHPTQPRSSDPLTMGGEEEDNTERKHMYRPFARLDETIIRHFKTKAAAPVAAASGPTELAAALNLNRRSQDNLFQERKGHIFVISASPDHSLQYISFMNAIFAAQKQDIAMDVCQLGKTDSLFLQQASHITGGLYYRLALPERLLQIWLSVFLGTPETKRRLYQPAQAATDFRSTCVCHKQVVDIGFVCSVCLSVYCQTQARCVICDTTFPNATAVN